MARAVKRKGGHFPSTGPRIERLETGVGSNSAEPGQPAPFKVRGKLAKALRATRSKPSTTSILPDNGNGLRFVSTELSQTYFTDTYQHRILIGIPTLGSVRMEWHNAVNGLVVPVNWSNSVQTPVGFWTSDAQNIIAKEALDRKFEWLFLLEDDVVPPADLLIKLVEYMTKADVPLVSGLYPLKSSVPMPFIFRGRGNGVYTKFKTGELVQCDGVPTGCLLVHMSIIRAMAAESEVYVLRANQQQVRLHKIFHTPRQVFSDPALGTYQKLIGTSDLFFCDQLQEKGILRKAGWKDAAKQKYPYLVDTSINCGHIDRQTGAVYQIGRTGDELR
jgi:hypothetical protein